MSTRFKVRLAEQATGRRSWEVWMRTRRWWGEPQLTLVGIWGRVGDAARQRDTLAARRGFLSRAIERSTSSTLRELRRLLP